MLILKNRIFDIFFIEISICDLIDLIISGIMLLIIQEEYNRWRKENPTDTPTYFGVGY